jgi:hypothetical protein
MEELASPDPAGPPEVAGPAPIQMAPSGNPQQKQKEYIPFQMGADLLRRSTVL